MSTEIYKGQRTEKIVLIRQKCIKANPDRVGAYESDDGFVGAENAPVRLADVLLAIKRNVKEGRDKTEYLFDIVSELWGKRKAWGWNLHKDDLTEQSAECITFLADLLK